MIWPIRFIFFLFLLSLMTVSSRESSSSRKLLLEMEELVTKYRDINYIEKHYPKKVSFFRQNFNRYEQTKDLVISRYIVELSQTMRTNYAREGFEVTAKNPYPFPIYGPPDRKIMISPVLNSLIHHFRLIGPDSSPSEPRYFDLNRYALLSPRKDWFENPGRYFEVMPMKDIKNFFLGRGVEEKGYGVDTASMVFKFKENYPSNNQYVREALSNDRFLKEVANRNMDRGDYRFFQVLISDNHEYDRLRSLFSKEDLVKAAFGLNAKYPYPDNIGITGRKSPRSLRMFKNLSDNTDIYTANSNLRELIQSDKGIKSFRDWYLLEIQDENSIWKQASKDSKQGLERIVKIIEEVEADFRLNIRKDMIHKVSKPFLETSLSKKEYQKAVARLSHVRQNSTALGINDFSVDLIEEVAKRRPQNVLLLVSKMSLKEGHPAYSNPHFISALTNARQSHVLPQQSHVFAQTIDNVFHYIQDDKKTLDLIFSQKYLREALANNFNDLSPFRMKKWLIDKSSPHPFIEVISKYKDFQYKILTSSDHSNFDNYIFYFANKDELINSFDKETVVKALREKNNQETLGKHLVYGLSNNLNIKPSSNPRTEKVIKLLQIYPEILDKDSILIDSFIKETLKSPKAGYKVLEADDFVVGRLFLNDPAIKEKLKKAFESAPELSPEDRKLLLQQVNRKVPSKKGNCFELMKRILSF